jgi:hypothetical protein
MIVRYIFTIKYKSIIYHIISNIYKDKKISVFIDHPAFFPAQAGEEGAIL